MDVKEWLGEDNKLGQDIWHNKYQFDGESFDQWLDRVSAGDEEVKQLILEKKFLFGGRILSNRGLQDRGKKITFSNCYVVSPPEDNLESIYDTAGKLARTYSYGGGCGIDISNLAPRGSKINNAAKETSGAVSFMDTYSQVTSQIGQNGRRGALMISLDCHHPDLEEFIDIKTDLDRVTKANISVRITDDFMDAVIKDKDFDLTFVRKETGEEIKKTVKAKEVFMKLAKNNYDFAEPGCLFWDNISNWNMMSADDNFQYGGTNPCFTGDTLVDVSYKRSGVPIHGLVGTTFSVYSAYFKKGKWNTELKPARAFISGVKKVVTVYLADGSSFRCTPEHRLALVNGKYKEAIDCIGEELATDNGSINITHIVDDGQVEEVYDLTVEDNHNFYIVTGDTRLLVHNCAEEPLPSSGSCTLSSMNLSEFILNPFSTEAEFDFISFEKAVRVAVRAMNKVLDEGLPLHPLKEQRECVGDWRQIGIGIMGLADMLIKLGLTYGSYESVNYCSQIGRVMIAVAMDESSNLSAESGAYKKYNPIIINSPFIQSNADKTLKEKISKNGIRNSQLLTIAPTGTISTMLGISGGIEPIFANSYTRKTESLNKETTYYKVYTPIVKEYMDKFGLSDEADLPPYFVVSEEIPYMNRIRMQSTWQKYIDASISSTVNLPENTTPEQVFDLYIEAWKNGLKGITIYRSGCKRDAVLSTGKKEKAETKKEKASGPARGEILPTSESVIGLKRKLMTGCGSLHCEAFFDPHTGELHEMYLSKGSTGGCNNFMIGLSRLISLSSRAGVPLAKIVDQLMSTTSCPSYASRSATKKDTSKGSCCPMAIGYALKDMYKQFQTMRKANDLIIEETPEPEVKKNVCPVCGEELVFEGGCNICKSCGWSKCD